MPTVGTAYRQESILDYMRKDSTFGHTTRDVANALNLSTNAVLAAFKRLRTKGRVYNFDHRWYLTMSERYSNIPVGSGDNAAAT